MVGEGNGQRYVTYRALFASLGGMMLVLLTVFSLYLSHSEKKVSREVYDLQVRELCVSLDGISRQVEANARVLRRFGKNQELVLRSLRIEPVKDFD